ncbi:MAG: hypothetical protein LC772_12955, partial [Chloroflexi bacterium]|nr:hypothetical protein [Chloroflexota bacterium]
LYDDPRLLDHISLPPQPTRMQIQEDYVRYLEAPAPPDESLHRMLAERHGCTVRQAHFTLLLFRWNQRLMRLSSTAEEKEMVATAEQNSRSSG